MRWVVPAAALVACGPAVPAGGTSTGEMTSTASSTGTVGSPATSGDSTTSGDAITSGGSSATTAEAPTGGTTEPLEPCSEVYEGSLYIGPDTDLASLANLGRVTEVLTIALAKREQPDLSFLPCLHTVDLLLQIDYNLTLETTAGLVNLKKIGGLWIWNNPVLLEVTGFGQIEEVGLLSLRSNHTLKEIHLESLHTVQSLEIGYCEHEKPSAYHLALADLKGFSGLTDVPSIVINGNEALMSVDLFNALASNGGPPPSSAEVRFNPLLPETLVHEKLDALGVKNREVCGNMKGDPECFCPPGE